MYGDFKYFVLIANNARKNNFKKYSTGIDKSIGGLSYVKGFAGIDYTICGSLNPIKS